MAIFEARRSSGGNVIMYSMTRPATVDIVFTPGSLHQHNSSYCLAPQLASDAQIDAAINGLIEQLRIAQKAAKEALKNM
jgi:hypothetical protein